MAAALVSNLIRAGCSTRLMYSAAPANIAAVSVAMNFSASKVAWRQPAALVYWRVGGVAGSDSGPGVAGGTGADDPRGAS